MKNSTLLSLLLIPAAMVLSTGCASMKSTTGKAGLELAYKVTPGQSFTMKTVSSTVIKSENMGQEININMNSVNETDYTVLAGNADGSMQYEMEYKSMKQSASTPMGDNDTDFSSWIGKKTQFSLTSNGVLSNFQGFDKLPEIAGATGEKVNGDMIQKGMKGNFPGLPDHPVKIGETWTTNSTTDIPYGGSTLKTTENTTYTVIEKVKKDGFNCLKIDVVSDQKLSGEFEQQGMQLSMTRDTKTTGSIFFALEKGMYISAETVGVAVGQVDVPSAGITIPQDITTNATVTVTFN